MWVLLFGRGPVTLPSFPALRSRLPLGPFMFPFPFPAPLFVSSVAFIFLLLNVIAVVLPLLSLSRPCFYACLGFISIIAIVLAVASLLRRYAFILFPRNLPYAFIGPFCHCLAWALLACFP